MAITLDSIDHLILSDEEQDQYFNDFRSLERLWTGLEYLNGPSSHYESVANDALGGTKADSGGSHYIWGRHLQLAAVPQQLLVCLFHWYSVSACNLVRLIGWIADDSGLPKARAKNAKHYLNRVTPNVSTWRNKVGAHFAKPTPNEGIRRLTWT